MKKHEYQTNLTWTGNQGIGTEKYNAYKRDYIMLWFLHLASTKGIVVIDYTDTATGVMIEKEDGSGYFESVTLNPVVTIKDPTRIDETNELHQMSNKYCFIANSLNFKVNHHPICNVVD
jgi:organic hydroperoxide reductase OsmC/OhrA